MMPLVSVLGFTGTRVALAVILGSSCLYAVQTIASDRGNIVLTTATGKKHELTSSGNDYDPALSADGTRFVFVRRNKNVSGPTNNPDLRGGNEIWSGLVADPSSAKPVLEPNNDVWVDLEQPQFSTSGDAIFFLSWFGNGYSLYRVAEGTTQRIVATATDYWVLYKGPYGDSLLVIEDHLKTSGGHVQLGWIFTQAGERGCLVGSDRGEVKHVLASAGLK